MPFVRRTLHVQCTVHYYNKHTIMLKQACTVYLRNELIRSLNTFLAGKKRPFLSKVALKASEKDKKIFYIFPFVSRGGHVHLRDQRSSCQQ